MDLGGRLVTIPEANISIPAPQIYHQRYHIINLNLSISFKIIMITRFKMMQWLTNPDSVLMQEIKLPKFYRSLVYIPEETETQE